ncbi:MAG: hypothetical protein PHY04_01615 [Candidatus ainarchaeum sp.]|nr:hypothetical protein [Candidatus ainarchaeum sp.]MDD3085628.1 hypothetical protein [Candidatus ainarchaeum sp.]MDD4128414.1 hypothetical protein [Candidatus ainarchaeum sp.]MDD4467685.1 hypothetical protein [Candidatus ainarchaeum sp.]HPM85487.1 hypothetical protein [archaeon]
MVIKSKKRNKSVSKRSVRSNRLASSKKSVSNEGFFQRMKEVIKSEMPQLEKVRVKTFIVEKPVIIHDRGQRIDSDNRKVFDSKKSRYDKVSIATGLGLVKEKKRLVEEEVDEESEFAGETSSSDELGEEYSQSEDDFQEEGESDQLGEDYSVEDSSKKHVRSRGMFNNIWWKKALFWSILFWLLVLAVSMAMQAMKLIVVDLTRQWWVLLGIIILIGMVYFKFIDGKFVL